MERISLSRPRIIRNGEPIRANYETKTVLEKKYSTILRKGYIIDEYLSFVDLSAMNENLFCGMLLDSDCCRGAEYHRCIGINNHMTKHIIICGYCGSKYEIQESIAFVCKKIISAIIIHSQSSCEFTASQITLLSDEPKSKVRFHIKKYEDNAIITTDKAASADMRKRYYTLDVTIDDWAYGKLLGEFETTNKRITYLLQSFIPLNEKIKVMQYYNSAVHRIAQEAV